jgi:hypothetical protein
MIWMKTGKLADTHVDTAMRGRGSIVAGPQSRTNCVRDQFANVDCSRLRTVCGQFAFAAVARSQLIEAIACARPRTVCEHACWRGLFADADCLWLRTIRVRVPHRDCSSSRMSRVCGCGQFILCGYVEHLSRLALGLKSLRNQGVTRALS